MVFFFSQSQSPTECHVSCALLAHAPAVQTFYTSIHQALYKSFKLFLASKMKAKNKIKKYKKITVDVCNKYDGAQEFIINRVRELCSQEGILIDEIRTRFKANLFFSIKM